MYRRLLVILVAAAMVVTLAGCHNKKVNNPIAQVDSKQPDKVLFDRSMDAMKHNKFEVARMTLQTLINTYPDSEFVARAKLGIADSWYAEGGSAALAQAENEYNDFKTFFPNMPEAAEAQMKIGKIHYDQMEKADRDFTQAKRAEQAYRDMINEFPDSKLIPEAKARLREVQEVLAEREYMIGHFYYTRQSYPAAIARLNSLVDTYPLFSDADEALYLLAQAYVGEIELIRGARVPEVNKGRLIKEMQDGAARAYSRILTRYPLSPRAAEAKAELQGMKRPIPNATPEAVAQNKAEIESRGKVSFSNKMWGTFHKHPNTNEAARIGDPTMQDPRTQDAPQFMKHATDVLGGKGGDTSTKSVNVETVGTGDKLPPNQAPPRSDNQVNDQGPAQQDNSVQELPINGAGAAAGAASGTTQPAAATQASSTDTTPAPAPDQNASSSSQTSATPPAQINDVNAQGNQANAASQQSTDDANSSSSKKKKKKGLGKLNPF